MVASKNMPKVFHIHDPTPTRTLFAMTARRAVSAGRTGKGMDFRGYGFPEGSFPSEGNKVSVFWPTKKSREVGVP